MRLGGGHVLLLVFLHSPPELKTNFDLSTFWFSVRFFRGPIFISCVLWALWKLVFAGPGPVFGVGAVLPGPPVP